MDNKETMNLIIDKFDSANDGIFERREIFLPPFSNSEINKIIEGYLDSQDCSLDILTKLSLHIDREDTYHITRKSRIKINTLLNNLKQDMLKSAQIMFNYSTSIVKGQKEFILANHDENSFNITISEECLNNCSTNEGIVSLFYSLSIDKFDSILKAFRPSIDFGLFDQFDSKHKYQYGNSTYEMEFNIKWQSFLAIYCYFEKKGIDVYEIVANALVTDINKCLSIKSFQIDLTKTGNDRIDCEHLYNQLQFILRQYMIYVQEHELSMELVKQDRTNITFNCIPSCFDVKYAETNGKYELVNRAFWLFSPTSHLGIFVSQLGVKTFLEAIINFEVKYSPIDQYTKSMIDIFVNEDYLHVINDVIEIKSQVKVALLEQIYNEHCILYFKINETARAICDNWISQGFLSKSSKLFPR